MKKYNSFIAFAMMAVFSLSLISCEYEEVEDDSSTNKYNLKASGSIVVCDTNGNLLYTCSVDKESGYDYWCRDYDMSDATLTFKAWLSPKGKMGKNAVITYISFDVYNPQIELGKITDNGDLTLTIYEVDNNGDYQESETLTSLFDGNVTIEKIEPNKYITLKFSNCKTYKPPYLVFNGEIKYAVRRILH